MKTLTEIQKEADKFNVIIESGAVVTLRPQDETLTISIDPHYLSLAREESAREAEAATIERVKEIVEGKRLDPMNLNNSFMRDVDSYNQALTDILSSLTGITK